MSHSSAYGVTNIGGKMNHQTIYDRAFIVAASCRREFISLSEGGREFRSENTEKKIV
jgi:hypothetical protein